MCGIAGILMKAGVPGPRGALHDMQLSMAHRGPDDWGVVHLGSVERSWRELPDADPRWQIGLAHRRLSILDLSSAGHQPMRYMDRYWITFNGEVYNYLELRAELEREGYSFRSGTDTEVILAAYACWGTACFARFRGMWALLIFDQQTGLCVLSRDRLGIKPLYIWRGSDTIAFASELKAFRAIPGFTPRMNMRQAISFANTGYEDQHVTFLEDVIPLRPGTFQIMDLAGWHMEDPQPYWFPERIVSSIHDPVEAGQQFVRRFEESIRLHLRSDVPVGCSLSGGLDSSAIAMMVSHVRNGSGVPLHTFSCVYPGTPIDETPFIDAVTQGIPAKPFAISPQTGALMQEFDRFVWMHDEPLGGLSIYAAYCIARLTREQGVPVTLSGQGGDEILSGYWQSYFLYLRNLVRTGHAGACLRHFTTSLLPGGNPSLVGRIPFILGRYHSRRHASSLVKRQHMEASGNETLIDKALQCDGRAAWRVFEIREMFLPRLLRWEDRNSMAFSVEGRYPFLDHEMIELCLAFDPDVMYRGGWTKMPLRLGLSKLLPGEIAKRRSKLGYAVPQKEWIYRDLSPMLGRWIREDRPVFDLVERHAVQDLLSARARRLRPDANQSAFRIFALDRWMELFLSTPGIHRI